MPCWPVSAPARSLASVHTAGTRKIRQVDEDVLQVSIQIIYTASFCIHIFTYITALMYSQVDNCFCFYLYHCRSTNMKGKAALVQILQKQSRISILRGQGVSWDVRSVTCSNCGGQGHYHLTCERQCKHCSFLPYRGHLSPLVDQEGDKQQRIPTSQLQE